MYVFYAKYFPKLTFPSEFDSYLGGSQSLKLALVGWDGCDPMWQVRNLKRNVKSFQQNSVRCCSRYGEETSPYLKKTVYSPR